MSHQNNTSRRQFIQTTSLASAALLTTGVHSSLSAADSKSANAKLNIGIIGTGGRGGANLGGTAHENIYALCDVYDKPINNAKKRYPKAKVYYDWRKLLDDEKIDAVTISTADHHHALAAVAAMKAGKHVYCEKPLAHTVKEARIVQDEYLQRKDKIATQMGTQIHATNNYRRVVEMIQGGAIGAVREAHVWCGRSIRNVGTSVLSAQEKPKDYHWDVWLGPAKMRPYNAGYWRGGNLNWNRRWEFGNGVLGDMGSHLIDLPFWALNLKRPTSVVSEGPKPDPIACPPWQVITWEHAARKGNANLAVPLKLVWYHGREGMQKRVDNLQKKIGTDTDLRKWFIGVAFVGDKGILVADYGKKVLSPGASFKDYKPPKQSIAASKGHHREWTHACKTGGTTLCNFDYSGALIEHNLLGNVAHRVGTKLQWDAEKLQATNSPAANKLLTKFYRKGWEI